MGAMSVALLSEATALTFFSDSPVANAPDAFPEVISLIFALFSGPLRDASLITAAMARCLSTGVIKVGGVSDDTGGSSGGKLIVGSGGGGLGAIAPPNDEVSSGGGGFGTIRAAFSPGPAPHVVDTAEVVAGLVVWSEVVGRCWLVVVVAVVA